jgi:LysR family transcriptional regulator, low CO2-responsive transcriptional regulator
MRYINFNQMRSFHAVATTGNVTNAAKLLNVSQPTVTTQLKQLEERYDIELAFRMHRGVRLSPLGEELHRLTMRIFALEEEALDLFDTVNNFKRGNLAVGTVGPHFVMKLLAKFNKEFPGIKISVNCGNSEDIIDQLMNFKIDVGVVGNIQPDPALTMRPLSKMDIVLAVNRAHPWYDIGQINIEELEGADLVLREEGSETRRVLETALGERGITPNVVMEVDRDALREAAVEGLGAGIISEAEFRSGMGLKIVRIANADIYTEAFIVCLKERAEKRLVKALLGISETLNATESS